MSNTFVIGDIHGAYKALVQVLQAAEVTPGDTLIFLGDLVDGWSGSFETTASVIDLGKKQSCIFIRGNHDEWCMQWLETGYADPAWLFHGGQSTVESYARATAEERKEHLAFYKRMLNYYTDTQNRLFIHAGFSSMHGPEKEFYSSNYTWDRTLWEMALCMDKRVERHSSLYPKRLKLYKEIFIGHTPTLNYDETEPMNAINVWNIDTGAAFYGRLSIMNVETKQFWQSDIVQQLYPNEKGRNKS